MEEGLIQVFVYTSRAKIPVEDATIVLTQYNEQSKDTIIAIEVTNYSGNSRTITLPTPPEEASASPAKRQGYTLLDVWVEHPQYITQKIEGVQIFPDTETTLPVELYPLAEGESSLSTEIQVDLPAQDL